MRLKARDPGSPALRLGAAVTAVLATLLGLAALSSVTACGGSGSAPSSNADLGSLLSSAGPLSPLFDPATSDYSVGPALLPSTATLRAMAVDPAATVTIGTAVVPSGGASAPFALPMGSTSVSVVVTAPDGVSRRTYVITHTRGFKGQQGYFKASNTDAGDHFGDGVAVSGDTLVVGAWGESSSATGVDGDKSDNSAPTSGAVYVFVRSGTTWIQQAYLKASKTDPEDHFGFAVAVDGDTLVVGVHLEDSEADGVDGDQGDNSATDSGAVYVFVRSGITWTQQAYIKASNSGAHDLFGASLALSGDTLVVGAQGEDSVARGVNGDQADDSASASGAAYVFVRSGTTWTQQAYLKASNADPDDVFGFRVSVSGDTLVVGARGEGSAATGVGGDQDDESAARSGAAYVFVRNGTTWTQQAYVKASNTDAGDDFGSALALSGDTLVVGALWEGSAATGLGGDQDDDSAFGAGAAYIFGRSGSTWTQQAYVKASNAEAGDLFAAEVALSTDVLVVTSSGESSSASGVHGNQMDNSAFMSGAAYIFVRDGGLWTQYVYLKASNSDAGDIFGDGIAFSGGTLLAGAWGEASDATGVDGDQADNSVSGAGAAYLAR